ncbi:alkyl hydroperoxide reductase subunit AhpC [Dyadobacter arcticus]|uniref:Alkyl hydroperoxide reductase subunit AhpC n=2 Tax=Dyadobacter arcticus TaxID=1078754 RepID=A0ABX0USK4_9BACT|nr:thioredoxin-like domain-containing protein [Dyadobacter arcticus]NIJ55953.1 alkyl hydroperoxide reductase subunit AhpC [Dyadobacter arcticus]
MPFLKKLEEQYKNRNIAFVGISIDAEKSYEKWRSFIKDKTPAGIQILADNDWNSAFIKDYSVNSIPRFILINP